MSGFPAGDAGAEANLRSLAAQEESAQLRFTSDASRVHQADRRGRKLGDLRWELLRVYLPPDANQEPVGAILIDLRGTCRPPFVGTHADDDLAFDDEGEPA